MRWDEGSLVTAAVAPYRVGMAGMGEVHAGREATLYYYNGQELERIGSAVVAENGEITLPFTHASDYAIVIKKRQKQRSE